MEPQSPSHPAPPDPSELPNAHVPTGLGNAPPKNYTAPTFGPPASLPAAAAPNEYSFITDQGAQKPRSTFTVTQSSQTMRIITVVGGVFVLLIMFVIIKNILSAPSSNVVDILTVAEDQSELTHLATEAAMQQGVSSNTLYSAMTINASISTDQTSLLTYCKVNKIKINPVKLLSKESKATDLELTTAAQNGLYDQTYRAIMESQLASYQTDLKDAYNASTGKTARPLLSSDYNNAKLLDQQVTSPLN